MFCNLKVRYKFALWIICCCCFSVKAQQFSVATFRVLPNDITAYIHTVKDLNQEACALIKVVGSADFVFSTPLGIVKRKEEVGEIWIYVPNGTVQITIKHPRWGVLRDYLFRVPLESRMTYELVLKSPEESFGVSNGVTKFKARPVKFWNNRSSLFVPEIIPSSFSVKGYMPWRYIALANVGFSKSFPLWGIRIGMFKRHGFYVSFNSQSYSMPETVGSCDKDGKVVSTDVIPYYSGETQTGSWKILVGGLHRLTGGIYLYEGVGYGENMVAWETSDEKKLYNEDFSVKGISAEMGVLYRFRLWALSVGLVTIAGKYWEPNIGVGICFK